MDLSIEGISKRKALLLIIICFCIFFLGTVGLGGISIRIMVLMLLLIYGIGNIPKYTDNTIFNWYIIYLITLLFFSLLIDLFVCFYYPLDETVDIVCGKVP